MRLGRNFLWQFLGQGVAKALGLLFYLLLPRLMGLAAYGQFAFALSLSLMILQPLLELGLDMVLTKWISRDRLEVIQSAAIIRGLMALLCLGILPLLGLLKVSLSVLFCLYVYLVLLSIQRFCFAVQRGYEQMRLEAIVNVIHKGLAIGLLWALAARGIPVLWLGPMALMVATAIATIIAVIYTWPLLTPAFGQAVPITQVRQTAAESIMLGGVVLLGMLYFRIDTVMLGLLRGDADVGLYNAAYKLIEGTILLPSVIMIVTFPRLAQPAQFTAIFKKVLAALGGSGVVVCLLMTFFAPTLILTVYGSEFREAVAILQLLSLTLMPIYLGHLATQSLVALDQQRLYLLLTLGAVVLNVGLNGILIPTQGPQGAAIATAITETAITAACFLGVWRQWGQISLRSQ